MNKLKSIIIFSFALFIQQSVAFAQHYNKSYYTPSHQLINESSRLLADGNLLIAGGRSANGLDQSIFVAKINTITGDTVWTNAFSALAHNLSSISADELTDGSIVVAASCIDTGGSVTLTASLSSVGALNWSKIYNYPAHYPRFRSPQVKKLAGGNFLLCNSNYDTLGIALLKLNSTGDTLFSRAIRLDSTIINGDFLVTDIATVSDGYFFTGTVGYSTNQENFMLFKTDTNGIMQWARSDYHPTIWGADAGLYATGAKMVTVGDTDVVLTIGSGTGLLRADRHGNLVWFKFLNDTTNYYSGPGSLAIGKANDGGLLITGMTDFNGISVGGKQFILKTDVNGSLQWGKKYKFEKNSNTSAFIAQLTGGDIICSGTIYDTAAVTSIGNAKCYAMRLDSNGVSSGASCSLDTVYSPFEYTPSLALYRVPYHEFNGFGMVGTTLPSDRLPVTVNAVPVLLAVRISSFPEYNICQGNIVQITADFANAGTSPTFNFLVNRVSVQFGANSTLRTSSLTFPDTVQCIVTSNAACLVSDTVASNVIIPPVYPAAPPSVRITASPSGPITPGTSVTFTATITNGGPTWMLVWYKNNIGLFSSTNSLTYTTDTLRDGDNINCKVYTQSLCTSSPNALSNNIIVSVPTGIPSVSHAGAFSVYPNPAANEITVHLNNTIRSTVTFLDVYGKVLKTYITAGVDQSIFVGDINEGLYFVEVSSDQRKERVKVIVQR